MDGLLFPNNSNDQNLSEEALIRNMFMLLVAEHKTTTTTIRYGLVLLALCPEVQEWMYSGTRDATQAESTSPEHWNYSHLFPKIVAQVCVMVCFDPVVHSVGLSPNFRSRPCASTLRSSPCQS